jgi:N utilization substance protein B
VTVEPRDLALEALYEADQRDLNTISTAGLPPKAARLVTGVLAHRDELDAEIDAASEHWRVARMPVVDRAILRLGLYELRHEPGTPVAVVIAEAVRLAKTFSTERSGAFVNGVLAALAAKTGHFQ